MSKHSLMISKDKLSQFFVDEIISARGKVNDKIKEADEKRKSEIDALKKEIDEMSKQHDDAIKNAKEAQTSLNSDQRSKSLLQKKKELQQQKTEYEKKIQSLQDSIQKIQSQSNKNNYSASLSLMQSIAPIRFSSVTPTKLSGIISYGTPSSTESFEYDRSNSVEIPEKFWKQLLKCYNARYNVNQNSDNGWNLNDGLSW